MGFEILAESNMKAAAYWSKRVGLRMGNIIRDDVRSKTLSGIGHDGKRFKPYKTGSDRGRVKFTATTGKGHGRKKTVKGKVYTPTAVVTMVQSGNMLRQVKARSSRRSVTVEVKGNRAYIARFQTNGTEAGAKRSKQRRKNRIENHTKRSLYHRDPQKRAEASAKLAAELAKKVTGAGTGAIPARPFLVIRPSTFRLIEAYTLREIKRAFESATLQDLSAAVRAGAAV